MTRPHFDGAVPVNRDHLIDERIHSGSENFIFKYRKYAEALYDALRDDAFYSTMERSIQDTRTSKEAMLRYMEYSMVEGEKYGELYVPWDHAYGVSVWLRPLCDSLKAQKSTEKKSFLLRHMSKKSLETYRTIVEYMAARAEPFISRDSWYLSIVGVLPEFQGRGLGSELIRNVLRKTDNLKVPTYLETFTPRNMTFYRRLGYQEVESFPEPTTEARYWLMAREPSHA